MKDITLSALLEVIGDLFSDEISIAVSNTKEYIYYRPSKRVNLKITKHDPIKEGTIAYQAIMSKQKVAEFIHRDVFGVPYHGVAVPIWKEDEIEGVVTAIYPALADGKSVVTVKTADGWIPVPFSDLVYVESKDKKTFVHSDRISGTHKYSLQDFESLLPKDFFIRCHRSFIVNVNEIKAIYPDAHSTFLLAMKNGDQIPVSQSYSGYFRKLLGF
ncbi:LytTR family DNA-binding domain-containing protein [Priestia koreensis]|uniref:LytTR family DNA-binding domain-containing protein n=1 Tax=Priestia koreensis TaxID=284581 RepID=UPI00345B1665